MIKECNVVLNNGENMVLVYDGQEVQMPSVAGIGKTAYVKLEKGRFTIVDRDTYEKSLTETVKKPKVKKEETIEDDVELSVCE